MKILVLTAVAENERDLQIVVVAPGRTSAVVTLEGAAPGRTGNPYLVYGDIVEDFTGCDKYATCINVFDCRSGDLDNWDPAKPIGRALPRILPEV